MGSSRELAIGPVALVSLMMATLLQKEFDPIKQAADYHRLAFTATFFAGITQPALGFLRYSRPSTISLSNFCKNIYF